MEVFSSAEAALLALGLTLPRIVGAFVMLPLISPQNMPAMVRNSFLVSLAIVALPIVVATAPSGTMSTLSWPALVVKELFIGIAIGFCFGIVFWAIAAAGNVIDTQIGMSMATVFDPIQGHQTSLHAEFLSEFAAWVFMASGAFLVFLDLLMGSYAIWPPTSFYPDLASSGMSLFVDHFGYFMTTMLVLAAPVMVILLIVDLAFGLVNRYAPQLNVFALTLPLKAWAATGIILLLLGVYVEVLVRRLKDQQGLVDLLQRTFGG